MCGEIDNSVELTACQYRKGLFVDAKMKGTISLPTRLMEAILPSHFLLPEMPRSLLGLKPMRSLGDSGSPPRVNDSSS